MSRVIDLFLRAAALIGRIAAPGSHPVAVGGQKAKGFTVYTPQHLTPSRPLSAHHPREQPCPQLQRIACQCSRVHGEFGAKYFGVRIGEEDEIEEEWDVGIVTEGGG